MNKKTERHIIASLGTLIVMSLLFLLLWVLRLSAVVPEEEGVEIEFAELNEEEFTEPASRGSSYVEQPTEAAPAAPSSPAKEINTRPEPSSAPEHIMSEEETLALERARKEKEEREAAERARKQKEAEAIARAQQMGNLFGKTEGTNTEGDGSSQGAGQKGNPVPGKGNDGGNSWSLTGRGLKGTLPLPANNFKQEGTVIVRIRVNAAGQVISATVIGGDLSDKQTHQLAIDAAYKAKFTEGDHDQIGTITYIFKVKA